MDSLAGPLSEGKMLLQLSVLLGVTFVGVIASVSELVGVSIPSSATGHLLVGGFVLGVGVVFLGHVVWHYHRYSTSN